MAKFLIIGDGFIGNFLARTLPDSVHYKNRLWEKVEIEYLLDDHPSTTLINCAGKTGRPNIDWCESHKDETFDDNVKLPAMIAETCQERKIHWIHIGSGCIYDGYDKAWMEEDPPNFAGSFYSRTKIWSQDILADFANVAVLRIRMPIDDQFHERNYIRKLVMYAKEGRKLFSLPNSMTYLPDLARFIEHVREHGLTGPWNVVNSGKITAEEVLEIYKEKIDPTFTYKLFTYSETSKDFLAPRSNCVLSNDKMMTVEFQMPNIKTRIEEALDVHGLR